jgi:hypothetical protein
MDVQITDFGDFIHKIELDYDNEYFYFDTRLRTYWRHLLQLNGKHEIPHSMNSSKIPSKNHRNRLNLYKYTQLTFGLVQFMVFNATLSNISVISWRSDLLAEETGVPAENHRPVPSHLQT